VVAFIPSGFVGSFGSQYAQPLLTASEGFQFPLLSCNSIPDSISKLPTIAAACICVQPFDIKNAIISTERINLKIEETKQGFILYFKDFDTQKVNKEHGYYISLKTNNNKFYFLPLYHTRNSLRQILSSKKYLSNDFYGMITHAEIPADTYQIGLISTLDASVKYFKTGIIVSTRKVDYQQ
jgi:hypothetical protein